MEILLCDNLYRISSSYSYILMWACISVVMSHTVETIHYNTKNSPIHSAFFLSDIKYLRMPLMSKDEQEFVVI